MGANPGRVGVFLSCPPEGVLVLVGLKRSFFNWCDCVSMLRDASARGVLVLVTRRS